MGYALFTARKMSLQAQVNNYNLKLMQINNEQTRLTEEVTRNQKANNAVDTFQSVGTLAANATGYGAVAEVANTAVDMGQQAGKEVKEAQLAAKQQQLDTEKQRFETLLKSASAELESVEKAEDSAIKSSTPSYVG